MLDTWQSRQSRQSRGELPPPKFYIHNQYNFVVHGFIVVQIQDPNILQLVIRGEALEKLILEEFSINKKNGNAFTQIRDSRGRWMSSNDVGTSTNKRNNPLKQQISEMQSLGDELAAFLNEKVRGFKVDRYNFR